MSQKTVKNIAASVRKRLLNRAREEKRPFNELLQYYAIERFPYRLSEITVFRKIHSERGYDAESMEFA